MNGNDERLSGHTHLNRTHPCIRHEATRARGHIYTRATFFNFHLFTCNQLQPAHAQCFPIQILRSSVGLNMYVSSADMIESNRHVSNGGRECVCVIRSDVHPHRTGMRASDERMNDVGSRSVTVIDGGWEAKGWCTGCGSGCVRVSTPTVCPCSSLLLSSLSLCLLLFRLSGCCSHWNLYDSIERWRVTSPEG